MKLSRTAIFFFIIMSFQHSILASFFFSEDFSLGVFGLYAFSFVVSMLAALIGGYLLFTYRKRQ